MCQGRISESTNSNSYQLKVPSTVSTQKAPGKHINNEQRHCSIDQPRAPQRLRNSSVDIFCSGEFDESDSMTPRLDPHFMNPDSDFSLLERLIAPDRLPCLTSEGSSKSSLKLSLQVNRERVDSSEKYGARSVIPGLLRGNAMLMQAG